MGKIQTEFTGVVKNAKMIWLACLFLPALLFWLAWEPMPFTPLVFIAFVPFFYLMDWGFGVSKGKNFGSLILALLLWNISTTWWVWFASDVGAIAMLILNSLLMFIPFGITRWLQRKRWFRWDEKWLFVGLWLMYEFGHHRWDLSWPWLCLGNAFSGMPWYVQWYELTGTLGGTALILSINLLIYQGFTRVSHGTNGTWLKAFRLPLSIVVFFGILSGILGDLASNFVNQKKSKLRNPYRVVAIQPNYDPYEEKFVLDPMEMVRDMAKTSDSAGPADCILWPETSLVSNIDVSSPDRDVQVSYLLHNRRKIGPFTNHGGKADVVGSLNPAPAMLIGSNMIHWYSWNGDGKPDVAARQSNNPEYWYTLHNSALWLGPDGELQRKKNDEGSQGSCEIQFYHKSKLVPGTEQLPFVTVLPFLERLAISLDENSASGTLGKNASAKALGEGNTKVAPIICYESIYGDYVSDYVKDGATWLAVITNDAWWNNTPGHEQHFSYAKLRAIEQRKWVVRSANTGISGFIDPLGRTSMRSGWYQGRDERSTEIALNKHLADGFFSEDKIGSKRYSEWSILGIKFGDSLDENHLNDGKITQVGNQLAMSQTIYLNQYRTVYNRLGDGKILIILVAFMWILSWFNRKQSPEL
jgi:apolipoprotein N-acyltransferase